MTAPEPSITLSLLDYIALEVKEYQETEGKDALFSINPNLLLDLCAAARRGVEADKYLGYATAANMMMTSTGTLCCGQTLANSSMNRCSNNQLGDMFNTLCSYRNP